jgi:hypothetical protein
LIKRACQGFYVLIHNAVVSDCELNGTEFKLFERRYKSNYLKISSNESLMIYEIFTSLEKAQKPTNLAEQ